MNTLNRSEHTPTPWKYPQYIGENNYWIAQPCGNHYSDFHECGLKIHPMGNRSINQDEADADLIVRAVNSYSIMLELLKDLIDSKELPNKYKQKLNDAIQIAEGDL